MASRARDGGSRCYPPPGTWRWLGNTDPRRDTGSLLELCGEDCDDYGSTGCGPPRSHPARGLGVARSHCDGSRLPVHAQWATRCDRTAGVDALLAHVLGIGPGLYIMEASLSVRLRLFRNKTAPVLRLWFNLRFLAVQGNLDMYRW